MRYWADVRKHWRFYVPWCLFWFGVGYILVTLFWAKG